MSDTDLELAYAEMHRRGIECCETCRDTFNYDNRIEWRGGTFCSPQCLTDAWNREVARRLTL